VHEQDVRRRAVPPASAAHATTSPWRIKASSICRMRV
jgi:hypothetical protein